MKKIITNTILILFAFSAKAQIGLDSLQVIAAKNNPSLKAAFYSYQAKLQQVNINKALPDPQVMFSYAILPTQKQMGDWDYQISVNQMFPWFGTKKASKSVAVAQAKSAYYKFLDKKNKLYADVALAYYRLYAINKTIEIYNKQLDLLKIMRSIAHTQYVNAKTSMADVLTADMIIAERENKITIMKEQKQPFLQKIIALADTNISDISFPDSLQTEKLKLADTDLKDSNLFQDNNRIAALRQQMKAWNSQTQLAKKSGLPRFSIGAEYMGMHAMPDMMMFPMVGISIPIHRKKYKAMGMQAQLMQQSVSSEKQSLKNTMTAQLATLETNFNNEKRNIALYNKLIKLSYKAEQILLQSYSNGNNSFDDVLKMEQRSLGYSLDRIQSQINLEKYYYEIQYLTGKNN